MKTPSASFSHPASPAARSNIRVQRIAVVLAIAVAFALNGAATWQRWGDLVIDTGRELDTPKQLAEGKMLYRDVRYWYGPLAPYAHSLLYRAFGTRLDVITAAGLSLAALLGWLSYRLLRRFVARCAATVGVVGILTMNAFGSYRFPNIFNFVLPYSFPAVYGTVLALASVYMLLRYLRNRRCGDFCLACGLLGLVSLCKLETLAAALAAHAAFLVIALRQSPRRWSMYAGVYGLAAAVPIAVYIYFRVRVGPGLWSDNLFIAGNVNASDFILRHSGLQQPARSLVGAATSLAELGACLGLGVAAAWNRRRMNRPATAAVAALALGVAAVVAGVIAFGLNPSVVLNGLPVILLVAAVWILVRWLQKPEGNAGAPAVLVLLAWALAAVLRLGLRCSAEHYGFYLAVPALLGLVVVACGLIPRLGGGSFRVVATAAGVALVAALTVQHAIRRYQFAVVRYPTPAAQLVRGPRGVMVVANPPYVGSADRAVQFLSRQPAGTRVVVFPEGCAMTFLAGCQNALGVHTFLPLDFSGAFDESAMIAQLQADPPEFVLLTSRDLSEYGARFFGEEYAQRLAAWIAEHYEVAETYQTRAYGVRILRRLAVTPAVRS